jgi:CRP-like cAMP-binding protein
MSRKRQNITLPADLILDIRIFANAKIVYAVLKTFPKNKVKADLESSLSFAATATSVTVTHAAIIERSGLSRHTVVKSLNRLETADWIVQERSLGSVNTYFFTAPS